MAYKVKSRDKHRGIRLPAGIAPMLLNVAAVVAALIVAITLPKGPGWEWVVPVAGAMLAAGVGLGAVTRVLQAALGKRAKLPRVAAAATIIYRLCFVLATCGLVAVFYRVAFR